MAERITPFVFEESAGTKFYCKCGNSKNLPYCDGSHRGTGITPYVVELEEAKTVAVCKCRQSGNRPWCDGTHNTLA